MQEKTKIIISVVSVILLVVGVVAGVLLVRRNQDIREKAAAASSMIISPSTLSKFPSNTGTFEVVLNADVNEVVGIDIDLIFDPTAMSITSMSAGTSISAWGNENPNNAFDNIAGTIFYSNFGGATSTITGPSLKILSVEFEVLENAEAGSYLISFGDKTDVAGLGVDAGTSVFVGGTSGTLTVTGGGAGVSCPGPYKTVVDGICEWSCGVGTQPDIVGGTNACICEAGLEETDTDEFGRIVCTDSGGSGGSGTPTIADTPTPTTAGGTATATPTTVGGTGGGNATSTPTPTGSLAPDDLPESGVETPFVLGSVLGLILLFGSVLLFIL